MLAFVRMLVLALVAALGVASGAHAFSAKPALRAFPDSAQNASGDLARNAAEGVGKIGLSVRPVHRDHHTGQYEDEETGLYYNRFRYYDPESGQYASQDPIGLWGGVRAYSYLRDPGRSIDPLGLASCKVTDRRVGPASHIESFREGATVFLPEEKLRLGQLEFRKPWPCGRTVRYAKVFRRQASKYG